MASRMETSQAVAEEPYYVTDQVRIIIGPSKGRAMGPRAPQPHMRYFYDSLRNSSTWQGGITVGMPTKTSGTISYGTSKLADRPAITSEVNPIRIGAGCGQDFEWLYKTKIGSSDTYVEFSSSSPPTHHVTYRLGDDAPSPEDMRLRVKAVFRQCGKFPRSHSGYSLPQYMRARLDRKFRHIEMELETRIGKEGEDNFLFPTPKKSGCHLDIEMNIDQGRIWQGDSRKTDIGIVKSKLESRKINI